MIPTAWFAAAWLAIGGVAPPGYGLGGADWASPAPGPDASPVASEALEAVVMRSLPPNERGCFFYAVGDLDGDGLNELLVQARGNHACGNMGCPLIAFRWKGQRLVQFSRTEFVRNVGVMPVTGRGLRPLVVAKGGGEYWEMPARTGRYPSDVNRRTSRRLPELPSGVKQVPWVAASACAEPEPELE